MSLVRFDPFRGFEDAFRKMGSFMGDIDKGVNIEYGGFAPRVDISEDEKNIFVHAEIPGVIKEDVKVTLNDENILTIKGEKKSSAKEENEDKTFIRLERTYGSFVRSISLPGKVKTESINARFENGVLALTLEKVEPVKPKEIEISVN